MFYGETRQSDLSSHESQMASLIKRSKKVLFRKGEYVFREGETAPGVYLILKGEVLCMKGSGNLFEQLISRRCAGVFVGNISSKTEHFYPYSGVATQETELVYISNIEFKLLLERHPRICQVVLADEIKALRSYIKRLKHLRASMLN